MIEQHQKLLTQVRTTQSLLQKDKDLATRCLSEYNQQLELHQQALDIVNAVTISTLQEVKTFIEEAVTLCLTTVYGNEYRFQIDYELKRGRSEASVSIIKGDEKLDPRSEVGGGVIDIVSLGMRLVLWMLMSPRTSPVFIFDEPFRFVSKDLTQRVVQLMKEMCCTFGIQIIMVSHDTGLIDEADKAVCVQIDKGVSQIVSPKE